MEDFYPKAYKEVIEILKYLSEEDVKKIPEEMINMFEKNMDKEYKYTINKNKPFSEQIMLKETREILAILYKDYWANEKQKERINNKLKNDIMINEQEKNKNYNPNDIFKTEEKNDIQEKTEKESFNSLIEHKENKCYKRILSFIKNIFKRQKNS